MDHAAGVRRGQGVGDLAREAQGHVDGQRPTGDALRQVFARNDLHRQEAHAFPGRVHPVNRGDVGVIQRGQQSGLALEASEPLAIRGKGVRQRFEGNLAIERRIDRPPHLSHPTLAEFVDDAVVQ